MPDEPSTPPGPRIQQQTYTETATSPVVGPTTEELESFNELIKFDHVYYKMAPPAGLVVTSSSPQIATEEAKVGARSSPNQKRVKPKQEQQGFPLSLPQVFDTSHVNAPIQQTSEIAFAECMKQESLDQLLELDSILEDDFTQNTEASSTLTLPPMALAKDSLTVPSATGLQSCKRKSSTSVSSPSPRNQRLGSDDVIGLDVLSPLGDSSYGSDLSDAASLTSDVSQLLGDDGWEESFTELFPSLV